MNPSPRPLWSGKYLFAILVALASPTLTFAEQQVVDDNTAGSVSYYDDIRPIFQAHCQGCHQPAKPGGEYIMTSFAKLLAGGESETPAIVPGQPDESHLIGQITPVDGEAEMPRNGKPLDPSEIALIRQWIARGAADDTPAGAKAQYDADHPPTYSRPPVITSMDYSPDGKLLAVAGFHEVLLHRADGSQLVARLVGMSERIESVQFSPDGSKLAVAGGLPGRMGEVQIWDVAAAKLSLSLPVTFDTVYGASWSPDQTLVAFGCADSTVRAINAETGEQVLYQGSHNGWVFDTVFSVDGSHLVSVGRDMTAKLTEIQTQRFVDNITSITPGALKGGITSVVRHPQRDEILLGGADGIPKIYRMHRKTKREIGDDANLLWELPPLPGRVFSVDYSRDASRIVAGSSLDGKGAVHIYGIEPDFEVPDEINKILVKPTHSRSAEEVNQLNKYFAEGIQTIAKVPVESGGIYAVTFSPDGSRVAAAGSDGLVRVLDASTGSAINEFLPVEVSAEPVDEVASRQVALTEPKRRSDDESLPEGADVVSLTVEPSAIQLTDKNDYVQVIVSAQLASGDAVDVTRIAKLTVRSDIAEVSESGQITPKASGVTELSVDLQGKPATVPISIELPRVAHQPDYIRDVMPVVSRVGCNAGTCHGSKDGKNGFKLSLRGYDPIADVRAWTDDLASRRVNVASPDRSLMLLKSTSSVPHEGGQVVQPNSKYYRIIRDWIAGGAKLNSNSARVHHIEVYPVNPVVQRIGSRQQMRVVATYADGNRRDVTAEAFVESGNSDIVKPVEGRPGLIGVLRRGEAPILVRFEGAYAATTVTVMGDREGFVWTEPPANNPIDSFVAAKLKRTKSLPSPLCTDYEFIRRVYLDLTGLPPTPDQIHDFVNDRRDSRWKRDELIDRLVGSPEYVEHWTNKWADLLQVNSKFLGGEGAATFRGWIRQEVAQNTPYDQFVRKVLTASGSNKQNPAASYYKILRTPQETMENTMHLFLATRFNCNKCHDHPFERWTQDQYYQMAAFFAQIGLKKDPDSGKQEIGSTAVEPGKPLYEIVYDESEGEVTHDRTGEITAPLVPYPAKFEVDEKATRRERLAHWITSPDNQYFARSYVNRLWGYLTGVGIIEPIDDTRAGNPPTNPELLSWLTEQFVQSGFDARHVIETICKSRTYQLSIETNTWNEDDQINYSHAKARRLPAEVLYDAIHVVTGTKSKFPGVPEGTRAEALPDVGIKLADGFLGNLGRPARESACECERSNDLQLGPIMALVSGPTVGDALADPESDVAKLVAAEQNDRVLVDELFLRILNRPANDFEIEVALDTMDEMETEHQAMVAELSAAEVRWAPREAELEHQRAQRIDVAEGELAAYRVEYDPRREQQQREREAKIAEAEAAVRDYEANLATHMAKWEMSPPLATQWVPLDPHELRATAGAKLEKASDLSILASGDQGRGDYDLTAESYLKSITGIRIEALADERLPKKGPGRADDGNFVLSELKLRWADATANKETEVHAWSFDKGSDEWTAAKDCRLEAKDGVLQVTSTGGDPSLTTTLAAPGKLFMLELNAKASGRADSQLFWSTEGDPGFDEQRSVKAQLSGDGQWLGYRYYFTAGADLTALRFDPDSKAGSLQIRAIKLYRVEEPEFKDLALAGAEAGFSQEGFDVKTAVDGRNAENGDGWAIAPQAGKDHTAVFPLKEPVSVAFGSILKISLQQNFNSGKHSLGRFRVSVTDSTGPLDFGLPADIKQILAVEHGSRTEEQKNKLLDFFRGHGRELKSRKQALADANKPLPDDPELKQLEANLALANEPVKIDPQLQRMREEVATSDQQLKHKRLTAAQDLAWALINNPAFLFNH